MDQQQDLSILIWQEILGGLVRARRGCSTNWGQLHSRTGIKIQTKEIGNPDVRNSLAPLPGEVEYEVITALLPLLSALGFHYSPLSV